MDKSSPYYRQVALLLSALPVVASERSFALKGGTAINLFVRDFPRLSVDIDLAYIPLESRDTALSNVRAALARIAEVLQQQAGISAVLQMNNPDEMRIVVSSQEAQIKIEVSPVARGALYPPEERDVVEAVEDEFGFASIQVVSLADLYGGKLCAALDRQHPRDFYDVKTLLETQCIDRQIFNGFITYLLGHPRPLSEVLNPRWKDISGLYANEFNGMTFNAVSLEELNAIPELMVTALKAHFTQRDYDFLMSFKSGQPDWSLAPEEQIQHLPAVKWKLQNIGRIPEDKHIRALAKLEVVLAEWIK
ncbi:nucleotidyl transferase AbiEii/AbiGii toxin family protein [Salmonella enterica]|nr:nucleotidyl transferase AbiEii/AbiGii toxin family protein [Salmonella enterica]EAQ4835185.1 nucleotidyl transferase AbiEii/AbiGii toxin family protein [Salmonella enterica]EAR7761914.1 nucleotidyl transferase AbiEii/AbiGii toxin family protein [Salmonella enterica]EBA7281705.1 nucleotidyl transferase AbiEii/AbiGii toxin family protein [Salmonella enterica]EBC7006826.1 nucleotidyl transferase AbiEii/AbiGii toxin family protein [Salmonella enterica]